MSALKSYFALVPGTYEVRFGAAAWGPVLVDAGAEVEAGDDVDLGPGS